MFKTFLNSFRTEENSNLIEAILEGYDACGCGKSIFDLTSEEREINRKEREEEELDLIPYSEPTPADPEPPITKSPNTTKSKWKDPLWHKAKAMIGKGKPIAPHAWGLVNYKYNELKGK